MADRTRIVLVAAVVPIVVVLGGVVLAVLALPDLPDPVAIHWGVTGAADGFGPAWPAIVLLPVLTLAYSAFALVAARGRGLSIVQRLVVATSPFLAVLLTATLVGSLWMQRGLDDAATAPGVELLLLGGTLGGLALGAAGWFVLPAATPLDETRETPEMLPLGATERAVWMQRLEPSGALAVFAVGTLALVAVVGVVALALAAPLPVTLGYGTLLLVIALLVAATLFWRVRVTEEGLEVRSAVGIPRFRIPLADVDAATVVDVQPVRDFGGWGLRWGGPGRFGVVTRRGEGLEVRRRNGKVFVVTVGDARTGSALLNSLVARRGTMS